MQSCTLLYESRRCFIARHEKKKVVKEDKEKKKKKTGVKIASEFLKPSTQAETAFNLTATLHMLRA